MEAAEQLTRALDQIATLASTTALRRKQIKLQVGLVNALMHTKGYAAPEPKAAAERARLLIEQAEALGEPPEDPLLLFSVLYSFWVANLVAFNGGVIRELSAEFLALAEKQAATVPRMIGNRLRGMSLFFTGDLQEGRTHLDRATALCVAVEHRQLAMRFGQDTRVAVLSFRSLALWVLGYPEAATTDADHAVNDAREISHAATLMYALAHTTMLARIPCGSYLDAKAQLNELAVLAEEKGASFWKALGTLNYGCLLVLMGNSSEAITILVPALTAYGSTGATIWKTQMLSYLARAHADLGQFDDAWRCINEATTALETTKEKWFEAELNRIAGEIATRPSQQNLVKAEAYFEQALVVARAQQARSWELRAAMSLARLWRDQGKAQQARELLAPVYGWFTEGFDTLDLKEAKALLEELAS